MTTHSKTRVLIVDDHRMVREGIVSVLADHSDIEVVGEAGDGAEALEKVTALSPDVVLLDIRMPTMDGIEASSKIRQLPDPPKVIVLSQYEDEEYVKRVTECGVSGYVLKASVAGELLLAIRIVRGGGRFFTPSVSSHLLQLYLREVSAARPSKN